ncbi:MAG TPA: trehalose-phosphatase, partial [Candidatus Omnitrophota bacterium]|nr:trehalose-phosphatase [Candidatus Omnitrophota bacterium]
PDTGLVLRELASKKDIKIAIISGRSADDVKNLVGIEGLIYAGNHGLEIKGASFSYEVPVPEWAREALYQLSVELSQELSAFKGVIIQYKVLTLSCHYRLCDPCQEDVIIGLIEKKVKDHVSKGILSVFKGKKVFEIRPCVEWNKGHAVNWLIGHFSFSGVPIYLGDDTTDSDAFKVLKERGISVWVGEPSALVDADFYLNDPLEVLYFLRDINA